MTARIPLFKSVAFFSILSWALSIGLFGIFNKGFAQHYSLQSPKSKVEFSLRNMGIRVDGHFNQMLGELQVNPSTGQPEFLYGEIQVNSIETGIALRDRHLLKSDYFNAERHPQLKFRSEAIRRTEKGWIVSGWISIKGKSQPIQITAEATKTSQGYLIKSKFQVKRSSFNLGDSALLSDEVEVVWTLMFGA
ncbi:MAG: YceI family protein [Bacteroidia bacterium]